MSALGRRLLQHRTAKARIGTRQSAYSPPHTTPAKGYRTLCPSPWGWVSMRSPRGQAELRCDRVQPHALDRGGLLGIVALVATGVLSAQEVSRVSSTFDPGETTIACSSARWSWRGFW